MAKKRRRRALGTGLGHGHGTNTPGLSAIKERPLSGPERRWQAAGRLEPDLKGYYMGRCTITVGTSHLGYHLSIAHPKRYPTWDEIAKARYELLPADLTFVMVFPPSENYVNHNNCFHLWEAEGLEKVEKLRFSCSR